MVSTFNKFVTMMIVIYVPERFLVIRKRSYPWITDVLKLMMRLKDDALARYRELKMHSSEKYYKQLQSIYHFSLM